MRKLKTIADFVLFSNIFVAFAFACLAFQTFEIIKPEPNPSLILFIFGLTLIIYSFRLSLELKNIPVNFELPVHLNWFRNHKKQMVLVFTFSIPLLIFCSFQLSSSHFIVLIPIGIISLGYFIPFIPGSEKKKPLREVAGLKIFLIALVVSCVTVFLPAISARGEIAIQDSEIIFLFAERFLFVFALAILFEIRDMAKDKNKQIKTIPVVLGEKKSKMIAIFSLFICTTLIAFHFYSGNLKLMTLAALIASVLITAIIILITKSKKNEYFFSFLVESMMVVQTVLVFLIR